MEAQEEFGMKFMLKALFEGQRDTNNKIDALHTYMQEHMEKEEADRLNMAVHIARLDEKVSSQSKKWGMISTVVTSVLSALGVSLFVGHK